jgi:hypothetical protein
MASRPPSRPTHTDEDEEMGFGQEVSIDLDEGGEVPEVEIVDDTPEDDQGREPMPRDIVEELEADELEEYEGRAKQRLKQLKKVWHDERREKEREAREKNEAISTTQRLLDENRRLKSTLTEGEQILFGSFKQHADLELETARREYREAYEAGDTEKVLAAQEKLQAAQARLANLAQRRGPLQLPDVVVEPPPQQATPPKPDHKTLAWQERNQWYGTDEEMTAAALGVHAKLASQNGQQFIGSDDYWKSIDTTMRKRFPEYFGEPEKPRRARPTSVVSPASRSTATKKVVLTKSQVAISKRLGLTPEQYAREVMKLEQQR